VTKIFEIFDKMRASDEITIRDDQHDFAVLLDSARQARRKKVRFRLVDTGRLTSHELEWLGNEGVNLYTSDEARPRPQELALANKACLKGGAIMAYLHSGVLAEGEGGEPLALPVLCELARNGVYAYLSNGEHRRDISHLLELAGACRRGGSRLIYYHHGGLDAGLSGLAAAGAWIHLSDALLREEGALSSFLDIVRESGPRDSRFILSIEKPLALAVLQDLAKTRVFLHFKTPPSDRKSSLRKFEIKAGGRKLDWRAYYLHPTFLL